MIINAALFRRSGGFPEEFLPIIEDVEFTHRMKRSGCSLIINPRIEVRHIFNFDFMKSMKNAMRKTTYWNIYSLRNGDLFTDSGSASYELKSNVAFFLVSAVTVVLFMVTDTMALLLIPAVLFTINGYISRRLLKAFHETGGGLFALKASLYYMVSYPVPVGLGTLAGLVKYLFRRTG
jgi:GT2 family glycosyltransferase